MFGQDQISEAWNKRGSGVASTVTEDGWKGFRHGIEVAEQSLLSATRFEDEWTFYAFAGLVVIGRAASRSKTQVREWFDEAHKRSPYDPVACGHMLQFLCLKWSGSHEEMYGFADWVNATAPPASPSRIVIPRAFDEEQMQKPRGVSFADFFESAVRAPMLADSMEKYLNAIPKKVGRTEAKVLNQFVYKFIPTDVRTRYLLIDCYERIADRPTDIWYGKEGIAEVFADYKRSRLERGSVFRVGSI